MARTLGSAALSASLLAADIVLLTLFLNPEAGLEKDFVPLFLSLFLPYAGAASVLLFVMAALLATFRWWPRQARPPIPELPWFTSLTFLAVCGASALFWLNLLSYRYAIPVAFVRALAISCFCLTGSALLLLAVVIDALAFPLRGRGLSAALAVVAYASALLVPLALRPKPTPLPRQVPFATEAVTPARRIVLLGIDGLGPRLVREGIQKGHLPALARMAKHGASGPLASLRPAEGPAVWATIFTGRLPRDHGVKGFSTYRLLGSETSYDLLPKGVFAGLLERAGLILSNPVGASSRKRRALWEELNAFNVQAGIVRFWGTQPPEHIRGFMLSNYFHLLKADPVRGRGTLFPDELWAETRAKAVGPGEVDAQIYSSLVDLSVEIPGDSVPWKREIVERALAPDISYKRAGDVLLAAYEPPFFANYFYGLDVVGHAFTRFGQPDLFGDVSPQGRRRYGLVVEGYAALLSKWVSDYEQALRPGEILFVVSGYGMEPVPLWRRLLLGLEGSEKFSGTHDSAPDGFLLAVGDGIRPGALVRQGSILDVAPTLLYLMGLPVARDMEGRVLTEIVDEEFALSHPVSVIPSYESLAVTPLSPGETDLPPLPEDAP